MCFFQEQIALKTYITGQRWKQAIPGTAKMCHICTKVATQTGMRVTTKTANNSIIRNL